MTDSAWYKITLKESVVLIHTVWGVVHEINGPMQWAKDHDIDDVREVVKRLGGKIEEIPE
jgi:hypothetical protein